MKANRSCWRETIRQKLSGPEDIRYFPQLILHLDPTHWGRIWNGAIEFLLWNVFLLNILHHGPYIQWRDMKWCNWNFWYQNNFLLAFVHTWSNTLWKDMKWHNQYFLVWNVFLLYILHHAPYIQQRDMKWRNWNMFYIFLLSYYKLDLANWGGHGTDWNFDMKCFSY